MFRHTNRQRPLAWVYRGEGWKYRKGVFIDTWVRDRYEHFVGRSEVFSHHVFGYTMRVLAAGSFVTISYLTGRRLLLWSDDSRPLYERKFQRWVPVTFIDRTQESNSDVYVYRFALPNSYDYTGHPCFSSCMINLCNQAFMPTRRYYTPINHPQQRGIIEFAIKHHDPGEMSMHLRAFEPGETCYIGGWLKEMQYKPNTYDEVGFIAGNSGISPFLQLLTCALADPNDKTKFSLLYANYGPHVIPFKDKLTSVAEKFPDRVKVNFVVQTLTDKRTDGDEVKLERASRALELLGTPLSQCEGSAASPTSATAALLSGKAGPNTMVYDDSAKEVRATAVRAKNCFVRGKEGVMEEYKGYVGFVDRDLILETMPWPNEMDTSALLTDEERAAGKTGKRKILVCGPARMLGNICGRSVPIPYFLHLPSVYVQGVFEGLMGNMGYTRFNVHRFGYTYQSRGLDT